MYSVMVIVALVYLCMKYRVNINSKMQMVEVFHVGVNHRRW